MTIVELLQVLQSKQITVSVRPASVSQDQSDSPQDQKDNESTEKKLSIKAPPGALTPELKMQLKTHKAALIEVLWAFQKEQQQQQSGTTTANGSSQTQAITPVARAPKSQDKDPDQKQELPLSFAQQRLWLLQQIDPDSSAYNMPASLLLQGKLNKTALQQALDALVIRHEILRTTYHAAKETAATETGSFEKSALEIGDNNSTPTQQIQAPSPVAIDTITLPTQEHAKQWLLEKAQQPFNLASDSVLRVQLVRLDAGDESKSEQEQHIIQWVLHHIAVDAWSIGIVVQEFALLYRLAVQNGANDSANDNANNNPNNQEQSASALLAPLAPQPIQYADFAHWQRSEAQQQKIQRDIEYWKQTLATDDDSQPVLALPSDFPRPAVQTFNGARHQFSLNAQLSAQLQALQTGASANSQAHSQIKSQGLSPFIVLLGSLQLLLREYSQQNDIRVGVPNANRQRLDVQQLVGFFVNTLVMRACFPETTVNGFFDALKQQHLAAQEHQDVPFEMLVDALTQERDMSHTPLFQVLFNYLQADQSNQLQLDDLHINKLDLQPDQAKFDLSLTVERQTVNSDTVSNNTNNNNSPQFHCILEYNTDLFSAHTIARISDHYQHLLTQVLAELAAPESQLSVNQLSVLSEAEKQQQMHQWNPPPLAVDFNQDTATRFEQHAASHPEHTALIWFKPDGTGNSSEHSLTYSELNTKANQLAHWLMQQLGSKQEQTSSDLVALCLHRHADLLVALLAIQKAGAAYLPIDPIYPASRRRYILQHAKPALVITEANLLPVVQASLTCSRDENTSNENTSDENENESKNSFAPDILSIDDQNWTFITADSKAGIDTHKLTTTNPQHTRTPEQLAYVLYTSGSTGNPKGVAIGRKAFTNFLFAMDEQLALTTQNTTHGCSRWLAVTTIAFDIAGLELFSPLCNGNTLVLANDEQAKDPWHLLALLDKQQIGEQQIDIMQATPATWQMLLEQSAPKSESDSTFWQQLRVLCGGEGLPASLAKGLLDQGATLLNVYGPTETTVWSTCYPLAKTSAQNGFSGTAPIGRAIGNNQCYVLNAQQQLVPPGAEGELYIGGDGLANGYLHRPDLTEQVFVPSPFNPAQRLYRTGDKVRWRLPAVSSLNSHEKPYLEYLGRNDFQVKIRGFRIELAEIEQQLLALDGIKGAVALAITPHANSNQSAAQLVAFVVADQKESTQEESVPKENTEAGQNREWVQHLRSQLSESLPHYMVPEHIVTLARFPLTDNGKINRKALLAMDHNTQSQPQQAYVAPETDAEKQMCNIWAQLLNVSQVGLTDNFFQLGGQSLLATRVIAHVQQTFDMKLPLKTLFTAQTPQALLKAMEDGKAMEDRQEQAPLPAITPKPADATHRMSFTQQRLWLLDKIENGSAHYHLPALLNISASKDSPLNIKALEHALATVIMRHDSLRTCFVEGEHQSEPPSEQEHEQNNQSSQSTAFSEAIPVITPASSIAERFTLNIETLPSDHFTGEAFQNENQHKERQYKKSLQTAINTELAKPFNLAQDLMLRATLFTQSASSFQYEHGQDQHYALLVVIHHIAADGWSMALVTKEVNTYYQQYAALAKQENQDTQSASQSNSQRTCHAKDDAQTDKQSISDDRKAPNEGSPGSIVHYVTGVTESRQRTCHSKDEAYLQYSDYAWWQRTQAAPYIQQQLAYWQTQLADLPVAHSLPLDRPRPAVQTFNGNVHRSQISTVLSEQLQQVCQAKGCTLFMGLHSVFSALLARYSNESDIVIGTPVANREQAEVENMVGFFANTLVLRSTVPDDLTFSALLAQSRQTLLNAYQHQQVPFEQLVDALQPARNTSHSPLFQVMLTLHNNANSNDALHSKALHSNNQKSGSNGLNMRFEPLPVSTSQFDLTLEIQPLGEELKSSRSKETELTSTNSAPALQLNWVYNSDLFDHSTIARLAQHFNTLLQFVLQQPHTAMASANLLSEQEQQHIQRRKHSQDHRRDTQPELTLDATLGSNTQPRTALEQQIYAIWYGILAEKTGPDLAPSFGIHDNFFTLGGHSLLVIHAVAKMKAANLPIDAHRFYTHPTIAQLAQYFAAQDEPENTAHDGEITQQRIPPRQICERQIPERQIPDNADHITPDMLPLVALTQGEIDLICAQVPGGVTNILDIYPLAPLQEGIFFHYLLNQSLTQEKGQEQEQQTNDPYILPHMLMVKDQQAFNDLLAGINWVIARHDVLRTAVIWEEKEASEPGEHEATSGTASLTQSLSQPVQVVLKQATVPVTTHRANNPVEAQNYIRALSQQPQQLRIDQAPMLDITLAKAGDGEPHYLLLRLHHLISDHEGLALISAELAQFQHALETSQQQPATTLLPAPTPYREFVASALDSSSSNSTHSNGDFRQQAADFFSGMLGKVTSPTLPFNLHNIQGNGDNTEEASSTVPNSIAEPLRAHCRKLGISPASVFHLAFAQVVAACSERVSSSEAEQSIVFGTVLSGRSQANNSAHQVDLTQAIGVFMNTLPVRFSALNTLNTATIDHLSEALSATHQQLIGLLPFERYPLTKAMQHSGLATASGDMPLFSALLNYRHSTYKQSTYQQNARNNDQHNKQSPLFELLDWHERTNYPFHVAVDDFSDRFELEVQITDAPAHLRWPDNSPLPCSSKEQSTAIEQNMAARVMAYLQQALANMAVVLDSANSVENSASNQTHSQTQKQYHVLPEQEVALQARHWNQTERQFQQGNDQNLPCVVQLFEQQVALHGDRAAVSFSETNSLNTSSLSDTALSYAQLNARVNQLAARLQQLGVTTNHKVVVCQKRSVNMLVSLLAVLKAGGAYVPVDPSFPAERVSYMLQDVGTHQTRATQKQQEPQEPAQTNWILTDQQAQHTGLFDQSALQSLQTQLINVDEFFARSDLQEAKSASEFIAPTSQPDQLAYLIYTSGSTGKPKGVELTRGNMSNFLLGMQELFFPEANISANTSATQKDNKSTEQHKLLAVTSLSFDIAVLELFLPLISGAEVVIGDETLAQDGLRMQQVITDQHITLMQATPVSWKILLATQWQPQQAFTVLCGGEPFPVDLAQSLLAFPTLSVWNMYGPTETTVWSSVHKVTPNSLQNHSGTVPIGQPIANTQLLVLDAHHNPVPFGVAGELCIGGTGVAKGYAGSSQLIQQLNAHRFVNTAFGRLYRTGDLARYCTDTQGNLQLHCLGRTDHQVKVRGFRIELGEIETALAQHPQVKDAVVHAHYPHTNDPQKDANSTQDGRGEPVLLGYVLLQQEQKEQLETNQLQSFLANSLPDYMLPQQILAMPAFPLTPNGKVDRNALPGLEQVNHSGANITGTSSTATENEYVEPASETERQLQQLWQELLDPANSNNQPISTQDNFFQLGGHSLLATRLMMRCRDVFQVKLALADMFQAQTIATMAQLIEQHQAEQPAAPTLDDDALDRIDDLLAEFE